MHTHLVNSNLHVAVSWQNAVLLLIIVLGCIVTHQNGTTIDWSVNHAQSIYYQIGCNALILNPWSLPHTCPIWATIVETKNSFLEIISLFPFFSALLDFPLTVLKIWLLFKFQPHAAPHTKLQVANWIFFFPWIHTEKENKIKIEFLF